MENKNTQHEVSWIGRETLLLALSVAGISAAKILISLDGSVNGHVDAGCANNPQCVELVINTIKNLPYYVGAYVPFRVVLQFVYSICNPHPDGGNNYRIDGKMK